MLVFLRCVCVCVGGWGVCGGVCVCGSGMLICFVSALGAHEMGRHKLPIIMIIIIIIIIIRIIASLKANFQPWDLILMYTRKL